MPNKSLLVSHPDEMRGVFVVSTLFPTFTITFGVVVRENDSLSHLVDTRRHGMSR